MPLPTTTNYPVLWMDAGEKFITKDSNNKVTSVCNRVNENIILPETGTSSPTWIDNQINGYPALSFAGAQSLYYNFPYNAATVGAKKPLILIVVAKIESFSPVSTICALASSTNVNVRQYLSVGIIGTNKINCIRIDNSSASDFINPLVNADSNYHIYTQSYNGSTLRLRVDGTEVGSVPATNSVGDFSGNKMYIGSVGNVSGPFTGKIAEVLLYTGDYGCSLDYNPELYLKDKYGL